MLITYNNLLENPEETILLRVLTSGNAKCGVEWNAVEHIPPYTRLYYMVDGEGIIESKEGITKLCAGRMYLIPAAYSFSYSCPKSMQQLFFHINLENASGANVLRNLTQILSMSIASEHVNRILSLYESHSTTDLFMLNVMLQSDILNLLQMHHVELNQTIYSEDIKRAVDYIQSSLSVNLSIRNIAENCFVSPNTLSHKFKKEIGMSVGKYVDSLIMFKAGQLLTGSTLTVAEISRQLGFYDQFYFSRRFKEYYSIPPLQYRKNNRIVKKVN